MFKKPEMSRTPNKPAIPEKSLLKLVSEVSQTKKKLESRKMNKSADNKRPVIPDKYG